MSSHDPGTAASPVAEKGGGGFHGLSFLLCENPLPPLDAAIEAAAAELPRSNLYADAFSQPLRDLLAGRIGVAPGHIHINAGSELILRQLFDRFGQQVHLLTPTYVLFPQIAERFTETRLDPQADFAFDLDDLEIPAGTTMAVIVNPNNPNGGTYDMTPLPRLLEERRDVWFLVDEAFIELAGTSVAHLVPDHPNLVVTQTLSKAHSLAGFRIGYAIAPQGLADDLNEHNDAYPLARVSQAAAIATLERTEEIASRVSRLRPAHHRPAGAGHRCPPHRDLLLPRERCAPRRRLVGRAAARPRHPRPAARRRTPRSRVPPAHHRAPGRQRTVPRRARRAARALRSANTATFGPVLARSPLG